MRLLPPTPWIAQIPAFQVWFGINWAFLSDVLNPTSQRCRGLWHYEIRAVGFGYAVCLDAIHRSRS